MSTFPKNSLLALLLISCLGTHVYAEKSTWTVVPEKSPVGFTAVGKPGFLKINGEGAGVEGSFVSDAGKLSGTFSVPLSALTTGIDLRDEHMKDKYLEVSKYPKAVLVIKETGSTLSGDKQSFNGLLKLKDEERPVSGMLSLKNQETKVAQGHAEFEIKLSDFPSVGVPSYKGITVAETVKVNLDLQANRGP